MSSSQIRPSATATSDGAVSSYTGRFYKHVSTTSGASAREIVPIVLELLQPQSVIDVGCGMGTWLAEFRRRGVTDLLGLDGPWVREDNLEIPTDMFVKADLTAPVAAPRTFDLVMSLEVAEHLPPESAENFVRSLTGFGSVILFSAAIPGQGGTRHLNEQWPSYWIEHFSRRGYTVIDCLRPRVWGNDRVSWWYAQNMLLFIEKRSFPKYQSLIGGHVGNLGSALSLVHPGKYQDMIGELAEAKQHADPRESWCSDVLQAIPHVLARAIRNRVTQFASGLVALTPLASKREG